MVSEGAQQLWDLLVTLDAAGLAFHQPQRLCGMLNYYRAA